MTMGHPMPTLQMVVPATQLVIGGFQGMGKKRSAGGISPMQPVFFWWLWIPNHTFGDQSRRFFWWEWVFLENLVIMKNEGIGGPVHNRLRPRD